MDGALIAYRTGLRRAFTLIEVLVVVAIIALLMAVLLPSLENARAQARTTMCLANLKQIGAGMTMYRGDHRGWLPVGPADRVRYLDPRDGQYHDDYQPGRQIVPWFNCAWGGKRAAYPHDFKDPPRQEVLKRPLTNYFYKGAGLDSPMPVFQCPSDTGFEPQMQGWIPEDIKGETAYNVCGNSYYTNPWSYPKQSSPKRTRDTSKLILVEDAPLYFSINQAKQFAGWHRRFSRHNILFLDFHASSLYVDPRTYDPTRNAQIAARQYQGQGWFAINYFEIMDYYR